MKNRTTTEPCSPKTEPNVLPQAHVDHDNVIIQVYGKTKVVTITNDSSGCIGVHIGEKEVDEDDPPSHSKTKPKKRPNKKAEIQRETMTFIKSDCVSEEHIDLLHRALAQKKWIISTTSDFHALFSGRCDKHCSMVWTGEYGKGTLVELFKQLVNSSLISVPKGFTIPAILEGHFKDNNDQWLTNLDKGNKPNNKASHLIKMFVKLLEIEFDPEDLLDKDDFQSELDPSDTFGMHFSKHP